MAIDSIRGSKRSKVTTPVPQDSPKIPEVERDGLPSLPEVIDASLTPQQCAAIGHLISGKTLSSTATLLGIDRKTLYNWRQLPAFRRAVHALSAEACEAAAMRMRKILLRSSHKLLAMLEGPQSMNDVLRVVAHKRVWDVANTMPGVDDDEAESEAPESAETAAPSAAEVGEASDSIDQLATEDDREELEAAGSLSPLPVRRERVRVRAPATVSALNNREQLPPRPLPAVKASPTARVQGRGDQETPDAAELNPCPSPPSPADRSPSPAPGFPPGA